jgi:hypothetical protein
MESGGSRTRPGGPKNKRDIASKIDNQSNSASNTKQKIESDIFPDQTRDVGVFLYCFKPPCVGRRLRRRPSRRMAVVEWTTKKLDLSCRAFDPLRQVNYETVKPSS